MKRNKIAFVLFLIVTLAIALRFYRIGSVPPSPDWDETALGYNAYSILHTGRDEYGKWFPIIFRSFDDYKPGLYVYLAIPFVAVFGLSTWVVRMPSVVFGVLTVLATYFLTKALLFYKINQLGKTMGRGKIEVISLFSSFLLAISPWHIQFSRVAFEANVGLSLFVAGLLFFIKGLEKKQFLYLSAGLFALAPYVYQSEKVLIPITGILLGAVFYSDLVKNWRTTCTAIGIFILVSFPFYFQTLTIPQALLRAQGVSIFADKTPFLSRSVERLIHDHETENMLGFVFDNRRVTYIVSIIDNYLSHFDLNWLFITGDQARHQPPDFGHLYLIELPFLLIGIYILLFSNMQLKIKVLLIGILLTTPISASITTGVPHPVRVIHFLPTLQILTALGVISAGYSLKRHIGARFARYVVVGVFVFVALVNFTYYLDQYFVQYNPTSSEFWQYGYEEAVSYVASVADQYDAIVVSNQQPLDQSYMFFLYYLKYDPKTYVSHGGSRSGGFAETNSFGKYTFRPINWEHEDRTKKILFIGAINDFPGSVRRLKTISYLNGKSAFAIVTNQN